MSDVDIVWRNHPVPHLDIEPGRLYFPEVIVNGVIYVVALILLIAVLAGVFATLRAIGRRLGEDFRTGYNRRDAEPDG